MFGILIEYLLVAFLSLIKVAKHALHVTLVQQAARAVTLYLETRFDCLQAFTCNLVTVTLLVNGTSQVTVRLRILTFFNLDDLLAVVDGIVVLLHDEREPDGFFQKAQVFLRTILDNLLDKMQGATEVLLLSRQLFAQQGDHVEQVLFLGQRPFQLYI